MDISPELGWKKEGYFYGDVLIQSLRTVQITGTCCLRQSIQPEKYVHSLIVALRWGNIYIEEIRVLFRGGLKIVGSFKMTGSSIMSSTVLFITENVFLRSVIIISPPVLEGEEGLQGICEVVRITTFNPGKRLWREMVIPALPLVSG